MFLYYYLTANALLLHSKFLANCWNFLICVYPNVYLRGCSNFIRPSFINQLKQQEAAMLAEYNKVVQKILDKHTHIHTHTHTHTQTRTHTQTQTRTRTYTHVHTCNSCNLFFFSNFLFSFFNFFYFPCFGNGTFYLDFNK